MDWIIDGNNVFGSKPDGWWNDRGGAMERLTNAVARWARTHNDSVLLVFDPPVSPQTIALGGGNLEVRAAPPRGRDAADHLIVELAAMVDDPGAVTVVTSDRGLRSRLAATTLISGVNQFRQLIGY